MKKILNKKVLGVLLAVMMLLSLSAPAFADTTGTVTVVFTQNLTYSESIDGTSSTTDYYWLYQDLSGADALPVDSSYYIYSGGTVNLATLNPLNKPYIPSGETDRLPGDLSLMDAIYYFKSNSYNYDIAVGYDYLPSEGYPGAFVANVDDQDWEFYYDWNDDYPGEVWEMGSAIHVAVMDAQGNITFPTSYPSNVEVEAGTTIIVDFGTFSVDHVNPSFL